MVWSMLKFQISSMPKSCSYNIAGRGRFLPP